MTQELISLLASGISFGVTAALGKKVIPWLHKLKYGQTIKEIGPKWHEKKQGTPTMGGIMFIAGILISMLICLPLYYYLRSSGSLISSYEDATSYWVRIIAGILMAVMFGAVGFLDDYIKVVKKQNDGLTPRQKMIFMTLITGAFPDFRAESLPVFSVTAVGNELRRMRVLTPSGDILYYFVFFSYKRH